MLSDIPHAIQPFSIHTFVIATNSPFDLNPLIKLPSSFLSNSIIFFATCYFATYLFRSPKLFSDNKNRKVSASKNVSSLVFIKRLYLFLTILPIANRINKPMTITSGVRCEEFNPNIKGSLVSSHMPDSEWTGLVVDIACTTSQARHIMVDVAIKYFRRIDIAGEY